MKSVLSSLTKRPVLLLLTAAAAIALLYSFLLLPGDLRSAAGLADVQAEQVESVTFLYPWPGSACSRDPVLIARGLALLEDTPLSRRSFHSVKRAFFPGGGNQFTLSFTLKSGETVSLREVQQDFVFDEAAFTERLLALADQCPQED